MPDIYVDKVFKGVHQVGGTLLSARLSRYVVDLNRSVDDIDRKTVPDHPSPRPVSRRGVVPRATVDGLPTLDRPLSYVELQERLDRYYAPYHESLESQLQRLSRRFGFVILLSAHSMRSSLGRGSRRADVVPGTRGRSTAASIVIDLVEQHFSGAGLSVRHDDPFRGGWTTRLYGRPNQGVHAVQIEINRAVYIDEETLEPKAEALERLQALVDVLVRRLGGLDLRGYAR